MTSIDQRIVSIRFDNSKFEAGVSKTIASLAKLNTSLKLTGAAKGLQDIDKAANKVTLSGAGSAADKLKAKMDFSGAAKSLQNIGHVANTIAFTGVDKAIDGLKGKFQNLASSAGSGLSSLKSKFTFPGLSGAFDGITNAASRVNLGGISSAIERAKGLFHFGNAPAKAFAEIDAASQHVSLPGISAAVSAASNQFSLLSGAASVALGNIASKALAAGASATKSLTITPIGAGLKEYETGLNSVQTILANTQDKGSTLKDVNAALAELNTYSDKTIYNFGEMAKNIGTFTAAGVDLKTATQSIKGIANLAALSGSNSEQASTAMEQLSQAIASGKVGLQDWTSVVHAGMGGAVFQKNLVATAVAMGTLNKSAVKIDKTTGKLAINGQTFRDAISAKSGGKTFLTSEVLTKSLSTFTGDLTDAQLAAQGFSAEAIKGIQKQAKSAVDAATKVKTLSQVFDVAKETAGSGFANTFKILFGDFEQAKSTFTGLSNAVNGVINKSATARNNLLTGFAKLGGRDKLIEGIKNAFKALGAVLKPIKEAFREIFPAETAKNLYNLANRFANFTDKLKIGPKTAENLKRTFKGFFALLDIGKQIIQGFLHVIGGLFKSINNGAGGVLGFTGGIGDFLVTVDKAIKKAGGLTKAFDALGAAIQVYIAKVGGIRGAIASFITGGDSKDVKKTGDSVSILDKALKPLSGILDAVTGAFQRFMKILRSVKDFFQPLIDRIKSFVGHITDSLSGVKFDDVFKVLQTALLGGIAVTVKKLLGQGKTIRFGVLESLKGSLSSLTTGLKALQQNVKAETLLKIAAAVVLLAGAAYILSTIDAKSLSKAMTAIAVGFGELLGAMRLLTGAGGLLGFISLPLIALGMIGLAAAMDVLVIAIYALSKLSWTELAKGLTGIGGALLAIAIGVRAIPASIVLVGPALIPLALALIALAYAVKLFGGIKWEDLIKGIIGIGGALVAIGLGMSFIGPSLLLTAPAMLVLAVSLSALAIAVATFGNMKLSTIAQGIGAIGAALLVIGAAVTAIPLTLALQAAGLVVLGVALNEIALAIAVMGNLKISTIAKGLTTIGLALVVLAAGLTLMSGTLIGSIALLAAATALAILGPALGVLGLLPWGVIVKGLLALGATLGVLGVVGYLVAPGLYAIGFALGLLGASVDLVGLGVYLLSLGLQRLGSEGPKSISLMVGAFVALIAILPKLIIDFIKGLVEVLAQVAQLAPKVVDSLAKIIDQLLILIIKEAPQFAIAAGSLILAFLKIINDNAGPILAAGIKLLLTFLTGISQNVGKFVTLAITIITTFLTTLAIQLPHLIAAGANVIVQFLAGVATALPRIIEQGVNIITSFLDGIAQGLPAMVTSAANLVVVFLTELGQHADAMITAGADLIVKVLEGLGSKSKRVADAASNMIAHFLSAAANAMLNLIDKIGRIILNFLEGLRQAIIKYEHPILVAGGRIGAAIMQGLINSFGDLGGLVRKALEKVFSLLPGWAKKILGIHSPSSVFAEIGTNTIMGFVLGITNAGPMAKRSVGDAASSIIDTMTGSLSSVPNLLDGLVDMDPVIAPVLDLTNVESEAKKLDGLTNVTPITAAASFGQASSISAAQEAAAQQSALEATAVVAPQEIKFEQNNYSPESLSTAELYRQTHNQFGKAKKQLGILS